MRKRGKIITGIISQTSSIACWVYVQDRKKRLQDVSDDGAIYMLPSVYSCIGITYNKTLLEAHGWELPKSFVDLETWQRKQKRRGDSCALHRLNIRKNRSKICVDLKKIIDVRKTTWYVFLKKRDYFKGKPVERQGRKARRD